MLSFFIASGSGAAVAESADETVNEAGFHLDDASLPQTAGEADVSIKAVSLCKADASQTVSLTNRVCMEAFAARHIPELYRYQYECAFVISPNIGGTVTLKNVWVQPASEVAMKRAADRELRKRVCEKAISLAQAQREIAEDWPSVYRHYVSNDVTVAIYESQADAPKNRTTPVALVSGGAPDKSPMAADVSQPGAAGTPPIEASVVAGSDQSGGQTGGQGNRNRQNPRGDGSALRQTPVAGSAYGSPNGPAYPLSRQCHGCDTRPASRRRNSF